MSGRELARGAPLQARRFEAVLSGCHRAVELAGGPDGLLRADLDDGQHVLARSVVVATGARWRVLRARGVDGFRGPRLYHTAMGTAANRWPGERVVSAPRTHPSCSPPAYPRPPGTYARR